jgi:cellulose synthase/poly-beta-1,6-N-acetylglucosamine synthase-like glycosyltransferase/peptidoglycan/xylan/chitin deacetylase (PgdA/CDA1 family)/spore germination protein YaaH
MNKPVFYDPQRKRWKRLRRILDVLAVLGVILGIIFVVGLLRIKPLPELLLQSPKRNFRALQGQTTVDKSTSGTAKAHRNAHRKTDRKPSEVTLNTDEGLRGAYYVETDAASYSSLKQHIKQIDRLFPEWLHTVSPDGTLAAFTMDGTEYQVVDRNGVHGVDLEDKVAHVIAEAHVDTEIFPLIDNYDPGKNRYSDSVGAFLQDDNARATFVSQVHQFLAANPHYHGVTLDFEDIPDEAQDGYQELIGELYADLHAHKQRLYINTPIGDQDLDLASMAAHSDGLLLNDFDEHQGGSGPGPVASQDWFVNNLKEVLKVVPKEKLICSLGSYGYDWSTELQAPPEKKTRHGRKQAPPLPPKVLSGQFVTTQEAWQEASDSEASVSFDSDSLNPHFAYDDVDANVRHQVWYLDAVTVLNEMRAARALGLQTFALWRLGAEDNSLWKIWDSPTKVTPAKELASIEPGYDIDTEGFGDIMKVTRKPQTGHRTLQLDSDDNVSVPRKLITGEQMTAYPLPYTVQQYGYHPRQVAISFDDGPDSTWTPKILDVLKKYNVKATFFMIGEVAENNVGVMQRVYREGHEIGNHTFTHPDISEISPAQVDLQLNLTERLFAAKLGVQPLYFRPPYSIDQDPDTNDQAAPVDRIQQLGYVIVGNKIDTDDWDEHPRKTPKEITDSIFEQISGMESKPWTRGSIILMHDGGGDRSATVAALPVVIQTLRARGYQIVPVSALLGKTRDQVMPALTPKQRWPARADSLTFFIIGFFNNFVVSLFFVGDILMSARLIIIGLFALIDRFRKRHIASIEDYHPRVAVLIPAYNEEKVIVRTVRSVLRSSYKNLRIVVIDDGSKDATYKVVKDAYKNEIESGRLEVLTKPNGGKAEALNYALEHIDEEVYVGIDADGVIAHDAIERLVPLFADAKIGAVAGNAKVGNRVNLWTRWQALEYITSQNFERRALDLFNVVMVVPGAIGAWRTAAVKAGGGYHTNTVAEDADLTMNLLEQGYSVIYEDRALAFTEAPVNMNGLMRQRFRWSFGILQALFKHRGAIRRHRAMGLFALPNILIFQIALPLVSPLIDFMFVAGVAQYFIDKHFHPEATSTASLMKLITFFMAFLIIDFAASALAFALERKHPASKGDIWLLFHIWIQRFTYRQVFSLVLLRTVKRAIDGKPFSWDKLDRTAQMSSSTEQITQV